MHLFKSIILCAKPRKFRIFANSEHFVKKESVNLTYLDKFAHPPPRPDFEKNRRYEHWIWEGFFFAFTFTETQNLQTDLIAQIEL